MFYIEHFSNIKHLIKLFENINSYEAFRMNIEFYEVNDALEKLENLG